MRACLVPEEGQVRRVGRARSEKRDRGRQLAGTELLEEPGDLTLAGYVQRPADGAGDPTDLEALLVGIPEPLKQLRVQRWVVRAGAQANLDDGSFPWVGHGEV